MHALKRIDESMRQIGEWIEKANLFIRSIGEKHELRMHNLDAKRILAERKFEKKDRELSKRIIETENKLNSVKKTVDRTGKLSKRIISLENKLNSVKKSLAKEKVKPLTTFERRVGRLVTILRKEGIVTSAIYSRRIGVSRKAATADLKKIAGMRIVKRRGKGRNAYYILAV
jgi:Fic family protein